MMSRKILRPVLLIGLAVCLVFMAKAQKAGSRYMGKSTNRIVVTDFGAVPDSRKDATAAIRNALLACKGKSNAALVFPKGRYDFFADSGTRKEYFISNTSSESECPSRIKTIGLLLEGMKDLLIEGEGSLFMFHGKMITFALDHCTNISLHNLAMDFERPTMSEFTITKSTPASVEVQIHPDSWYRLDSGRLTWYGEGWRTNQYHCIRIDTTTHALFYANEEYGKLMEGKITVLSPYRLLFRGSFDSARYKPGNVFTVRDPVRDEVGAFIVSSRNITLRNVQMHYMHGLGIVSQYSENLTMDSVAVEPGKGSGRWIASFADGMHFSGCKGQISLTHCRFNGLHDDAVNVHGTHLQIVKKVADHALILRFMHPQTYGFMAFFQKDSVTFVHPSTLGIFAVGQVNTARRLSDREILVTMQEPVPGSVKVGDVIENTTWTPHLTIRNCLFTGTNTRGLLVTTRRKVVIEDNDFIRLGMQAILIADDALSWYESGPVDDMLIRHNRFRECGHNSLPENYTIAIAPENHELTPSPVHRNIRIMDNLFYCYSAPVLTAHSVDGLTFSGNTITYSRFFNTERSFAVKDILSGDSIASFHFVSCQKVIIRNNRIDADFPGRNIKLESMGRGQLILEKQENLKF
ncbi:alpha-1,3-galactosidase-related protein [Flavitalea flava]